MAERTEQNLDLFQGDDLRVICTVRDQDGELIDISDASAIEYAIARSVTATADVTKSLAAGDITINTANSFFFDLEAADTSPLQGGYYHEAQVTTNGGLVYTVLSGRVNVRRALV